MCGCDDESKFSVFKNAAGVLFLNTEKLLQIYRKYYTSMPIAFTTFT